jgi:hypothetical protein
MNDWLVTPNEELFTTLPFYKYKNFNLNRNESGPYIFLIRPGGLGSKTFVQCGMQVMWKRVSYNLTQWSVLLKVEKKKLLAIVITLEGLARAPPLLLRLEPS